MSILESLKKDGYRMGNLQAIPYSRHDHTIFKPGFLGELYWMMRASGKYSKNANGMGILVDLFCGMQDLSFPAIVAYLSTVQLIVLGVWEGEVFNVAGVCFPTTRIGSGDQKAMIAGYGFLSPYWGSDEQELLAVLGIAMLFVEGDVLAIHGVRYQSNVLTAKFMSKFGFKDYGVIPRFLMRRGKLVDAVVSSLSREDFEDNLRLRAE